MSRIGKMPINIPSNVEVKFEDGFVTVSGPKGVLKRKILKDVALSFNDNVITFERANKLNFSRAYVGTARQLVNNMVQGVVSGYEKRLELVGLGYKAQQNGANINLALGYSHPIEIETEDGITLGVENNVIVVSGIDKEQVGKVAAKIKAKRVPDAYKGKGVRYAGEKIKTKEGKKSK